MKLIPALLAAVSLTALAACATTGTTPASKPLPASPFAGSASPYGLYLAGQAAMGDGDNAGAVNYFNRVAEAGQDEASFVRERAFISAVFGGDITRAATLAPAEGAAPATVQRLGLLTQAVENLATNKGKEAYAIFQAEGGVGFPHRAAAAMLEPWAAAAAGKAEDSIVRPNVRGDRLVEIFGQLGQAQLFERSKRYDEAETDYKALLGLGEPGQMFAPDYGGFLERRKRYADAVAVYDAALQVRPGDTFLQAARARATAKGRPPAMPTIQQGAARALLTPASALAADKQFDMAQAYLRLSLRLDPKRSDTLLLLGDVLAGMENKEAARTVYAQIPAGSPEYASARSKLAWSYQAAGDKKTALDMADQAVKAAPDDRDAKITWADLLRANERYDESVQVLNPLIAAQGEKPDWVLLYMRGTAYERGGRWPEAERDLQAALKLRPDEPELLNYLGYAWIDRGEHLTEAMAMVERAVASNPRSGAMTDSLGWAYYRLGKYPQAVEQLEKAVLLDPAEPEINDHLGDAYWQVGRKIEARFQWDRVLSLEPDDKIKAGAQKKLQAGLPPATPVVAGR